MNELPKEILRLLSAGDDPENLIAISEVIGDVFFCNITELDESKAGLVKSFFVAIRFARDCAKARGDSILEKMFDDVANRLTENEAVRRFQGISG